ncbi:MAG TPA: hypothetical protein VMD79_12415 [Solirubrobacteraceae bacterium]|nr:hypothetical protein [Solirubrobacteraceae bacterium]
MPNIIRRTQVVQPGPAVPTELALAQLPGMRAAAAIHAGAFASSAAMHHAASISRAADAAFKTSPMGEDVYRAVVLAFGDLATMEIRALILKGGMR